MNQPNPATDYMKLQQERRALELSGLDTPETRQRIIELKQQEIAMIAGSDTEYHQAEDDPPADVEEMREVLAEAYQVVGCLLSDLDIFHEDRATKILDNLNEGRLVHQDVLPWESVVPPDLTMELERLRALTCRGSGTRSPLEELAANTVFLLNVRDGVSGVGLELLAAGIPVSNPLVAVPLFESLRISIYTSADGDWLAQAPGWISDPHRKPPHVRGATMIEAGLRAIVRMLDPTSEFEKGPSA